MFVCETAGHSMVMKMTHAACYCSVRFYTVIIQLYMYPRTIIWYSENHPFCFEQTKQQEEEESDNKVTKAVLCQEGLLTLNFYGRMANIIPQFKTHSKLHKMCI